MKAIHVLLQQNIFIVFFFLFWGLVSLTKCCGVELSWWCWMTRDENVLKHVGLWAGVELSSLPRHFNGMYEIIVWKWTLVVLGSCPESLFSVPDGRSVNEVWFSSSVPAGSRPTDRERKWRKTRESAVSYLTWTFSSVRFLVTQKSAPFSSLPGSLYYLFSFIYRPWKHILSISFLLWVMRSYANTKCSAKDRTVF